MRFVFVVEFDAGDGFGSDRADSNGTGVDRESAVVGGGIVEVGGEALDSREDDQDEPSKTDTDLTSCPKGCLVASEIIRTTERSM